MHTFVPCIKYLHGGYISENVDVNVCSILVFHQRRHTPPNFEHWLDHSPSTRSNTI